MNANGQQQYLCDTVHQIILFGKFLFLLLATFFDKNNVLEF